MRPLTKWNAVLDQAGALPRTVRRAFREMPPAGRPPPGGPRLKPPPLPPEIVDMQRRIAVADANGNTVVGKTTRETASTVLPIESEGEVVGAITLELALEFIEDDELIEVTPEAIRLRKRYLDPHERKRQARAAE